MRLTRFTDNALRCLIVLGLEPGQSVSVNDVALRMNMSYEHLVKIVQKLTALGYIETARGRNGGARLAMSPETIVIGQLVRQTEENLELVECFDPTHNNCPISGACRLAGVLDDALNAFLATLDRKTLADVLEPRRRLTQLIRRAPSASPSQTLANPSERAH